jgi:glutaconyl-CoA decarboxylase
MNELVKTYHDTSRPVFCAKTGLLDEIANLSDMSGYLVAFASAVYQNPASICPHHHLILPRIIRG